MTDSVVRRLYAALVSADVINDCGPYDGLGPFMRDALDTVVAHMGRELEASGWRVIAAEPPPEDVEVIVGRWDETDAYIMNDYYSSTGEQWCDWHGTMHRDDPTHWRPMLPSPPTTSDGGEGNG